MFKGIDFCSDTATKPTQGMLEAMLTAEVGDEQKREDPTTLALEELIADMLGYSSALFFPSATMANEVAIRSLCEPGDELLAAANCHLFQAETGGPAIHANVMCKPIPTNSGIFTSEDIKEFFHWTKGMNHPVSKLLSVENTSNQGGGIAWSKEQLNAVVNCADTLSLAKHMDGSRLFNASVKTGLSVKEITAGFDAVTICLSKGLGCPAGALLVFDKSRENKIRRLKQIMGGAMRQSGILAAAGIYALNHHVARLAEDHENAAFLADELTTIPGIQVINKSPATNIIFFNCSSTALKDTDFHQHCIQQGLRFSHVAKNKFRAVTHLNISKKDIKTAVDILKKVCDRMGELRRKGRASNPPYT